MFKIKKSKILNFFVGCGLLFLLFNIGLYLYCYVTPKLTINKAQGYYLYDSDNKLIFDDSEEWISLDRISPYLVNATIYTEDKYYYKHLGFDYLRILKAVLKNVQSKSLAEGASTITQQYARNLFLNYDKNWSRKFDEAILAAELEAHYTKEEILEGYLNTINYGGVYGIENASWYYFGHSASELTLAEASMLAGIPQSPANNSPLINLKKAKNRQKVVLMSMVNNKTITENEMGDALDTNLNYIGKSNQSSLENVLYFRDAVMDELNNIVTIPKSILETGSFKVYTTLDVEAQKALENAALNNMDGSSNIQVAGLMMNPTRIHVKIAMIGIITLFVTKSNASRIDIPSGVI